MALSHQMRDPFAIERHVQLMIVAHAYLELERHRGPGGWRSNADGAATGPQCRLGGSGSITAASARVQSRTARDRLLFCSLFRPGRAESITPALADAFALDTKYTAR